MTKQNFGGLPVIGETGDLVGLVTEYDLLQAMIEGRDLRKGLGADIMTTIHWTAREDMRWKKSPISFKTAT